MFLLIFPLNYEIVKFGTDRGDEDTQSGNLFRNESPPIEERNES